MEAARRGGDWSQGMDGEGHPADGQAGDVEFWIDIYTDILAMEEKVLERVKELMATQTPEVRREVELTNVPVIAAQVDRFRHRLGYWKARKVDLDGDDGVGLG